MHKKSIQSSSTSLQLLPRVIRAKDAHGYLGMSRDVFNQIVKPYVTYFPIGKQGVGFDRLDLDNWLEQYKLHNGHPVKQPVKQSVKAMLPQQQKGKDEFAAIVERINSNC